MEKHINKPDRRSLRGFASMSRERQREIASKGGKSAHEKGVAHEFTTQEASAAARIGHQRGTAHEFTTEEARLAGRKGGMARANRLAQKASAPALDLEPTKEQIAAGMICESDEVPN